jgi:hypothetical protein
MYEVWSLNGARFVGTTASEVPRTLRWLKSLSLPNAHVPDVLCLQDFRVSLLQHLRPLPYFSFVPMTNHMHWREREALGICIASKWPLSQIDVHHSWGNWEVRDLEGVDENNNRIKPDELSDELVMKTENRVGIACSVLKPGAEPLRIATHHGFWTREGIPSENQIVSTRSMAEFLAEQGSEHDGIVYLADYNPDKEGLVHGIYAESGAKDCLPADIVTTLAPEHPAAKFGVKSDCALMWPNAIGEYPYQISDVRLDPSPGSDHLLLRCHVWHHEQPHHNAGVADSELRTLQREALR